MPCQTRGTVAAASEGAGADPAPGREESASREFARVLLLAKHRVLQALGEPELADTLRRDLEGLARLWVPSDAISFRYEPKRASGSSIRSSGESGASPWP